MDEPSHSPEVSSPAAPSMSLTSRLLNVYAAPGEVFEAIKPASPAVSNWLVPVLLACLVGVINVWVMFSQPAIQRQLEEKQAQQLEQMVEKGRMTREQADKAQAQMGGMQIMIAKIAGSVGAVVASFVWLFFLAFLLWLLARWGFKARFAYLKTVEVVGLASMIGVLGGIVTLLLVVAKGNMYMTLSPALLLSDFDLNNKVHAALSSLNLITLWYIGVLAVGLARFAGKPLLTTALWLYGCWLVLRAGIIASGLAASGM